MPPKVKPVRYNKNGKPRKPYTRKQAAAPTIADPTDPGTLRPNDEPEVIPGSCFDIRDWPQFDAQRCLPSDIDNIDPFALWSLFLTPEVLQTIVENTNKNAVFRSQTLVLKPESRQREWVDLDLPELYTWLALYIYMGMHIENSRKDYWMTKEGMPDHTKNVGSHMSFNRWILIWRNLRITPPPLVPQERPEEYAEFKAVRSC
jgi:hypothetical protein